MADLVLSDEQIAALLATKKRVTNPGTRWKLQRGSNQKNYMLEDADGQKFTLFLRQNVRLLESFSCGILYQAPNGTSITLTRYNGSDHEHGNPLDGQKLEPQCHIHVASARYMEAGRKSEHHATPTDRYADLNGALRAIVSDCNIEGVRLTAENTPSTEDDDQQDLFH